MITDYHNNKKDVSFLTYDKKRLLSKTVNINGQANTTEYQFNEATGLLESITYTVAVPSFGDTPLLMIRFTHQVAKICTTKCNCIGCLKKEMEVDTT